jgi:two-component system response regulator
MPNSSQAARNTVWVIEDNPDHACLIAVQLETLPGVQIMATTSDGEQALRYIEAWPSLPTGLPGLVLLDLQLPRVGGTQVLRALRASAAWRNVLVVILSTSTAPSDIEQCLRAGANAYLSKGRDLPNLAERVSEIAANWSKY